ncbi:MAG: DUF4160 domain-containing protein [Candidatus Thiosymbion ectosymbiont of Robbea hypermnestra]|nr:DUF4160 domain-containing protein [Candidatus Thiosymbion ectosymbiont of Robbea hypermnestra]
MPELARFFGIIIRMYLETHGPHHTAHFHAYYQRETAVFGIEPVELIAISSGDNIADRIVAALKSTPRLTLDRDLNEPAGCPSHRPAGFPADRRLTQRSGNP